MSGAKQRCLCVAVITALSGLFASKAGSTGDTVIQIDFVEAHDRLSPDERPGIVAQHQVVATLSAGNRVSENNQIVVGRHRRGSVVRQFQNNEALGDNSARAVWHVLGPHQLSDASL